MAARGQSWQNGPPGCFLSCLSEANLNFFSLKTALNLVWAKWNECEWNSWIGFRIQSALVTIFKRVLKDTVTEATSWTQPLHPKGQHRKHRSTRAHKRAMAKSSSHFPCKNGCLSILVVYVHLTTGKVDFYTLPRLEEESGGKAFFFSQFNGRKKEPAFGIISWLLADTPNRDEQLVPKPAQKKDEAGLKSSFTLLLGISFFCGEGQREEFDRKTLPIWSFSCPSHTSNAWGRGGKVVQILIAIFIIRKLLMKPPQWYGEGVHASS